MLLNVGLTKKPRHPANAAISVTVNTASNSEFRRELEIIEKPREPILLRAMRLVAYCRL
jgi:hypothetical protein